MKKINCQELLEQLQADTRQLIASAMLLKMEDPGDLLQQPAPEKWSVVQVLEHMNSYGRYYLLHLERSLQKDRPAVKYFKPGWLGNYFTRTMLPGENGQVNNKMQSPKAHRPGRHLDIFPVLNTFIEQQHYLLTLLEKAKEKNIGALRTPISISRMIRLKTGDTFRFFIAHERRHFVQIARTLEAVRSITAGKYPATLPVA